MSNPAWSAVLALPYLMEFPYECSEQIFNRLYANTLARTIANSDPRIQQVFQLWQATPALDSPLTKNADLKPVLLEETPWLRAAQDETQARRELGVFFEPNRLDSETELALQKLAAMQLPGGWWPWFPGGWSNEFLTLSITTGFGRLRHLGAHVTVGPAVKSLGALDAWMVSRYHDVQKQKSPEDYVPSALDALYLYGRSFFREDHPVAREHQPAVDFLLQQSRLHWLQVPQRQSQAHLALALKRRGGDSNRAVATAIMKSLKERSVSEEEMGRYWRDSEFSWSWFRAPIETQALMIEAFDEVLNDTPAVEECKVWLLAQKRTQDWQTTKATADALYSLLLRGANLLASTALAEVSLGGQAITARQVKAGTGFYEERIPAREVRADLADITVRKSDPGLAWGSVHWQYLEDVDKVTPHTSSPLRLKKVLYVKTITGKGPVLQPINGPVHVGDELVVRLELRVDRDLEFVHLKDQRGSGAEPVNVLSGYRFQEGLAYYESTRDTASHFFIDYLPKGTYVFQYPLRLQHRGRYQSGLAEIQCLYAPEFNSHSGSVGLVVE